MVVSCCVDDNNASIIQTNSRETRNVVVFASIVLEPKKLQLFRNRPATKWNPSIVDLVVLMMLFSKESEGQRVSLYAST